MDAVPEDVPQDIWNAARAFVGNNYWGPIAITNTVARALMAERDACARRAGNYLMLKTPLDVPRIVECEAAIRNPTP